MVSIVQKRKSGRDYYYLYHDSKGVKRRQYEEYLGKTIPADIKERKSNFLLKIRREEWMPKLELIHTGFEDDCAMMPKTILEKKLNTFAVGFTYNTQRIEGSTLSRKDNAILLNDGITPANKPMIDVREAEAHMSVFLNGMKTENLSMNLVLDWHKNLFEGTKGDIAGKIRDYNVGVMQSKFIPPVHGAVGALISAFFEWYESSKVLNPVELAALVHLKFVTIHPFGDGNGRISRLMMNHILYRSGYPMMNIKYTERRSYYNALERSQTSDDDMPFLQWFMKRYIRTHTNYLQSRNP